MNSRRFSGRDEIRLVAFGILCIAQASLERVSYFPPKFGE